MSEIIECPACSTRYKLNKPIPEGGRHVKCARCGHQWRMVPDETAVEDELEMLSPEEEEDGVTDQPAAASQTARPREHHDVFARHSPAGDPAARSEHEADAWAAEPEDGAATEPRDDYSDSVPMAESTGDHGPVRGGWSPEMDSEAQRRQTDPLEADDDDAYRPEEDDARFGASTSTVGWQARREHYASAISTLSDPDLSDFRADDRDEQDGDGERNRQDFQDRPRANEPWDFDEWADDPSTDRATAASRDDSRFRSVPQPPPEAEKPEKRASWASRLMPFKRSKPETQQPESDDDDDLGETEFEIREALNAALERPAPAPDMGDDPQKKDDFDPPADKRAQGETRTDAYADDHQDVRFPQALAPEDHKDEKSFSDDFSDFSFGGRGVDDKETDAEDEDEDPPFRLSGDNARRPIYGSQKDSLDEANPFEDGRRDADAFQDTFDDGFDADRDSDGRRDRRASGGAEGTFEDDFSSLYDRQFEGEDADRDAGQAVDEDFEALRSELEGTDITSYEREGKSGGGLAVVAAWAVFISIFSGALFGLVSFRQDIMTALPGTASLYAGLGFETENSGIDFADVSYRWTTANGKPMIEVTGQVVNVTDRTVRVPQVVVNVRDTGGANAVQAKASVPARELAPRQRASFSLEFLSPPENVAQIELELDRGRN